MIPYYAVHNSPVLPSVHLPRSSPDCPLHAAIWAGAQAAFPCLCWSDPQVPDTRLGEVSSALR